MRRDDFTQTVDGAAAYERLRGENDGYYDARDEQPSKAEADRDEAWCSGERGAW